MIDSVTPQPLFLSVNAGGGGGVSLTPSDGYDSENLSVSVSEPSRRAERKAREMKMRARVYPQTSVEVRS